MGHGISKLRKNIGEIAWGERNRKRNNRKDLKHRSINAEHIVNWRVRTKLRLIAYKGGKCEICGYNKQCSSAYDFHHIDQKQKLFNIGGSTLSYDKQKNEADKCILLCRNCHAELHEKDNEATRKSTIERWKKLSKEDIERLANNQPKPPKIYCCQGCRKDFHPNIYAQKYCSAECFSFTRRKVVRPTKEQLQADIAKMSMVAVGKKYGVSDNAIRKWLKDLTNS